MAYSLAVEAEVDENEAEDLLRETDFLVAERWTREMP